MTVYVKKWIFGRHAILFKLNNSNIQVVFKDKSEVIIGTAKRILTYVNKKRERIDYKLESALQSTNQDLARRVSYVRDLIEELMSDQNQKEANLDLTTKPGLEESKHVLQKSRSVDGRRFTIKKKLTIRK